jgi:hypothetical protein
MTVYMCSSYKNTNKVKGKKQIIHCQKCYTFRPAAFIRDCISSYEILLNIKKTCPLTIFQKSLILDDGS